MTSPSPPESPNHPGRQPVSELPPEADVPLAPPGTAGLTAGMAAAATTTTTDGTAELITCPDCGTTSMVDPGRRRAEDFCGSCDFPLFWARSAVLLSAGEETGASLRRLPGTVGRAATAALNCPHCDEPNSPAALICIRCDGDLHPAPPPPPPEPLPFVPPPPPPAEPEPEPFSWTWILIGALVLLVVAGIIVWDAQFG